MASHFEEDDDYEGLMSEQRREPKDVKSGLMNTRAAFLPSGMISDMRTEALRNEDNVELDENGQVIEKEEENEEDEEKELISDQSTSKCLAFMNIFFALLLLIPTIIASPDFTYEIISLYLVSILMLVVSIIACIWYFICWMPVEDWQFQITERAKEKMKEIRSKKIRERWDGEGDAPQDWVDNPPAWLAADVDFELFGDSPPPWVEREGSRTNIVINDDGEEIIEEEDSYETSDIHSESSSLGALELENGEDEVGVDATTATSPDVPPPFQGEPGVELTRMPRKAE